MKPFAFRLQQALEWRATELNLQRAHAAAAIVKASSVESAIRATQAELSNAAALTPACATGLRLESYAGFRRRSQGQIRDLETQLLTARKAADVETAALIEASRKLRVLENLKARAQNQWRREFDRELAAFADEVFLQAVNRRARSPVQDVRLPNPQTRATGPATAGLPATSAEAQ